MDYIIVIHLNAGWGGNYLHKEVYTFATVLALIILYNGLVIKMRFQ